MKCELIGIQSGTNRDGGKFTILHLANEFDSPEHGIGKEVLREYINDKFDLSGINLGMQIDISYKKGYDGKAYVDAVVPVAGK